MTKRFYRSCPASASAETAAEASSSCPARTVTFSDATLLASFFVAVAALRICVVGVLAALVGLSLAILSLLLAGRAVREEQPLATMS